MEDDVELVMGTGGWPVIRTVRVQEEDNNDSEVGLVSLNDDSQSD